MNQGTNAEREVETVGLVGAGRAGQWFVTKLRRADYQVVVHDADAEATADAVDRGAVAAEHPAAVTGRSDVVLLCLPDREAVEVVMEGADGVLEAIEPGQVVVDTGTTTPELDEYYGDACRERDAGYVDCGTTRRGPNEAEPGEEPNFTMFVGGEERHYDQVRPVIAALGSEHEFFEGIGNGHVVKAAVTLRATCRAALAAEVCEFLSNNDVDPERVVDLLEWEVPGPFLDPSYFATDGFERAVATGDGDVEDGHHDVTADGRRPRLRTSSWAKDPSYALELAHASNSHVPMLTAAYQTTLLAENYGAAVLGRELEWGDPEWHLFHLRSLYRALARPQAEWHRLSEWTGDGESE